MWRRFCQCLGGGTYPRRTFARIVTDSPVAAFIFDSDTLLSSASISRLRTPVRDGRTLAEVLQGNPWLQPGCTRLRRRLRDWSAHAWNGLGGNLRWTP